jgi:hypothetical protein
LGPGGNFVASSIRGLGGLDDLSGHRNRQTFRGLTHTQQYQVCFGSLQLRSVMTNHLVVALIPDVQGIVLANRCTLLREGS